MVANATIFNSKAIEHKVYYDRLMAKRGPCISKIILIS
jgi:hypothetical protein